MSALEEIKQMQQQGRSDYEITRVLQDKGISPLEINEALSQSRIKSAISSPDSFYGNPPAPTQEYTPEQNYSGEMQPSIMSQEEAPQQPGYAPQQTYEYNQYTPEQQGQESYLQQQYGTEQQSYQSYGAPDVETITEIATQIIEEKTNDLKNKTAKLEKFQKEAEFTIEKLTKELEKLHDKFNDLQMAILKEVGEYGKNIEKIAKESEATRESFSKMVNPLTDHIRGVEHKKHHKK
jgi:hypothetical protein